MENKNNIIKEKYVLGDRDKEMINDLEIQIRRAKKLKNNYKREINIARGFITIFVIIILCQFLLFLRYSIDGRAMNIFYLFLVVIVCIILPSMQTMNNINSISEYKNQIKKIDITIELTDDLIKRIRGD